MPLYKIMNNRIANFKVVCLLELSQSATSRLFPEVVFKNEKLYLLAGGWEGKVLYVESQHYVIYEPRDSSY